MKTLKNELRAIGLFGPKLDIAIKIVRRLNIISGVSYFDGIGVIQALYYWENESIIGNMNHISKSLKNVIKEMQK